MVMVYYSNNIKAHYSSYTSQLMSYHQYLMYIHNYSHTRAGRHGNSRAVHQTHSRLRDHHVARQQQSPWRHVVTTPYTQQDQYGIHLHENVSNTLSNYTLQNKSAFGIQWPQKLRKTTSTPGLWDKKFFVLVRQIISFSIVNDV